MSKFLDSGSTDELVVTPAPAKNSLPSNFLLASPPYSFPKQRGGTPYEDKTFDRQLGINLRRVKIRAHTQVWLSEGQLRHHQRYDQNQ